MNNCLVTKLKGVVNNQDLMLFDKVVFFLTGNTISIRLTPTTGKIISFSGSDGSERSFDGSNWLPLTPNVTYIAGSVADITGMEAQEYIGKWPKGLIQVPGLTVFTYNGQIKTDDLPVPDNIERVVLINRNDDNTEALINWMKELKSNCVITLQGNPEERDLISMGTLARFARGTATFEIVSSNVNGSIEDFVNIRRTVFNQSTGSMSFNFLYMNNITFNGSYITQPSGTTMSNLSWTVNTITFDGVTISG